jgi:hypothetical protein
MAVLTFTDTNVLHTSGNTEKANAASGVTITPGLVLTKNSSGEFVLADHSTATLSGVDYGLFLSLGSASPGQPVVAAKTGSVVAFGVGSIVGVLYYLGNNGEIFIEGDLATSDYISFIGIGNASGEINFQPRIDNVQRS